ncbi:hypothetical protein AMATHDRAFT_7394 [Amanita thiersii Skay4041]|uniref:Uncharacterized protein n=1 Tax=Amanita thiersii Skay4041 TaxID=703135 RepID=A0A2A9NGA0_9AGAR|nr:hypothetical protein AMATHDRAFT_7394 [Amanita thiersii Skay4041]
MSEAQPFSLAKSHSGISSHAPDSAVPACYIEELKKHLRLCPHDTHFRINLEPKRGFGRVTCLERGCNSAEIPLNARVGPRDGGKSDGLGSLSAYRTHIHLSQSHIKSRNERVKSKAPGLTDRPSPDKRSSIKESTLLSLLDSNSSTSSRSTKATSVVASRPSSQNTFSRRVSSLTRVRPEQASSSSQESVQSDKENTVSDRLNSQSQVKNVSALAVSPSESQTSSTSSSVSHTPLSVQKEQIQLKIKSLEKEIGRDKGALLGLYSKPKKSNTDLLEMDVLQQSIEANRSLMEYYINSIMRDDPFRPQADVSANLDRMSLGHPPNELSTWLAQPREPTHTGPMTNLYDDSLTRMTMPMSSENEDDDDGQDDYSLPSGAFNQLDWYPYGMGPSSAVTDFGSAISLGYLDRIGSAHRAQNDTFLGPRAQPHEIEQFLKEAGNAELFDGNATVEDARAKLGLNSQYELLPGMAVALLPHQIIGVAWMKEKESGILKGGALCDEMGLGKTVQMIATMVQNQSTDPSCKTNLIIAPTALLDQWKLEIELKTNNTLKCLIYHGSNRPRRKEDLLGYDVVLTTFQTMSMEWPDYEKEAKKRLARARKRRGQFSDDDSSFDERSQKKRKLSGCFASMYNALLKIGPATGLLFRVEFYRIVLDEAHMIRNKGTRASRAVTDLQATCRWCLTGTPIINSLADMYGYLRFLKVKPWYDFTVFQEGIGRLEKKQPQLATERLQAVNALFLLRRMKDSKLDGKRLIELPEKKVSLVRLDFTTEERDIYRMVEIKSQAIFNRYLRAGTVLKNYHHVLVLLLRLRQICSHPCLIQEGGRPYVMPTEKAEEDDDGDELARARRLAPGFIEKMKIKLKDMALSRVKNEGEGDNAAPDEDECPICYDFLTDPTVTLCTHMFCRECILDYLSTRVEASDESKPNERPCPVCRTSISRAKLFSRSIFEKFDEEDTTQPLDEEEEEDDDGSSSLDGFIVPDDEDEEEYTQRRRKTRQQKKKVVVESDDEEIDESIEGVVFGAKPKTEPSEGPIQLMPRFLPSTKMKYMMEELKRLLREKPDEKVMVISQWTSCLSLVSDYLTDHNMLHVKYQGDMNREQRDKAVREFMTFRRTRVMLMSLKCGGVGLNLTRANNVISLDLGWSQAVESQAFDRVHRLGQTKPVLVQRLVISNTVEERVLELQERKQHLADGSLGERTGRKLGRLSVRELANLFGLDGRGRRLDDNQAHR